MIAKKTNSEYFKERRKTIGQFNVPVSREKLNALTEKLNEKIDEELRE